MIRFEARASAVLDALLRPGGPSAAPWLLPANVCPVVPLALLGAGRRFELLDIEPDTLCLDRTAVLARLGRREDPVAGIVFVRTYGTARDVEPWFEEVRRAAADVLIVDDRCLGWPAFDGLDRSPADVVLYSTGYAKPVDAGGGGYAFVRDGVPYARHERPYDPADLDRVTAAWKDAIARRAPFSCRAPAWLDTRPPAEPFDRYRARVEALVPAAREHHARLVDVYREGLPPEVCLPDGFHGWRFQIVVPRRDDLVRSLFSRGLFAGTHYAPLTGVFGPGSAPVAERLHARVVNLFADAHYTEAEARATVRLVHEHLERVGGPVEAPWPV